MSEFLHQFCCFLIGIAIYHGVFKPLMIWLFCDCDCKEDE